MDNQRIVVNISLIRERVQDEGEGVGMLTTLRDARAVSCGGKATALAVLAREGLPVPDGFVIPFAAHRIARSEADLPVNHELRDALTRHLARMGDPPVAVRSSAANEDTAGGSAAGRYESVLAVRGVPAVAEAVRTCWASSSSARVAGYGNHVHGDATDGGPDMAVLVQRLVDADVSGVMFNPACPEGRARIEASWGLGPSVAGGTVTPDTYEIATDGGLRRIVARKTTRWDRDSCGVIVRDVPEKQQTLPALDAATAAALAGFGRRIADVFGQPQDIEWAIEDGKVWILQARPITAPTPSLAPKILASGDEPLIGTAGSHGTVSGIARVLRGPSDFPRVQPGDIAICEYTDPAWTPLFRHAAALVTETGGVLSHAAIVAREHGIPAVLGVLQATTRIQDGIRITVNGTDGTVIISPGTSP
ncbi:PEP/pyruvate-binding domain-containing protein [Microbacterium alcoholitolerans]|uniref:PEP/pyruvate-binding domain-containing protein n=1 Tax=unclassified Microbacterium TaxID=2609290 RepID=UPI003D17F952